MEAEARGSANCPVGKHDLELGEDHVPVLAPGMPVLDDSLGSQIEHPAQGIIVGKAGLVFGDLAELAVEALGIHGLDGYPGAGKRNCPGDGASACPPEYSVSLRQHADIAVQRGDVRPVRRRDPPGSSAGILPQYESGQRARRRLWSFRSIVGSTSGILPSRIMIP